MKKADVRIGQTYKAKVSDRLVDVRIDAESRYGGWDATNLATGKKIRIKSAQRLRPTGEATAAAPCPNCGSSEEDDDGDCRQCRQPQTVKTAKTCKAKAEGPRRLSALEAAAQILAASAAPMGVQELVDAAAQRGLWQSPGGKTPQATLYSAILREIKTKGEASRFRKVDRGRFVHV